MSDYGEIIIGSLKLRKKKFNKKLTSNVAKKNVDIDDNTVEESEKIAEKTRKVTTHLTKSQVEFERRRDKRMLETVLSKSDKSHKERIIQLNNHLSTLTEHFDVPKVSWTK